MKKKLKIKDTSMGNQYVIRHPKLGALVFDTTNVKSKDYNYWIDCGFADHFEEVPVTTSTSGLVEGINTTVTGQGETLAVDDMLYLSPVVGKLTKKETAKTKTKNKTKE